MEHIYLYNHKSVDNATEEVSPYVRAGLVDLHPWDLPGHPQKEAFLHCTHKYAHARPLHIKAVLKALVRLY